MYELVYGVLASAVDMLNWMFSHKRQMFVIFFNVLLKENNGIVIGNKDSSRRFQKPIRVKISV